MNNMMQLVNLFKSSQNPQQTAMNMLSQIGGNNPMIKNVMGMMQNGDGKGIEQFARNLCKERGVDPDQMFGELKNLR